jgi:hypothetical protein
MEIVTVSIIIGGSVLFFIGSQIIGICCRGNRRGERRRRKSEKRRRFYGTNEVVYGPL